MAFVVFALCALPFVASASTVQLDITGGAQLGSNYLDFGNYPKDSSYTPAPGSGAFEVTGLKPGVFSLMGVKTGEFGAIQSLDEGTGPLSMSSPFMTFKTGGSDLQLWATSIPAGSVGPYTLKQSGSAVVATFNVDGYVLDTSTGKDVDTFDGFFTVTFAHQTLKTIFSDLPVDGIFCADFNITPLNGSPAVPEPAAMLLTGLGVLGLVAARMRRSRA